MFRRLLVILIVAAVSGWISAGERAVGKPASSDWVRTSDGWESRLVVEARDESAPLAIHPGVVAALQLGVSVLFLLAFPAHVRGLAVSRATAYLVERRAGRERRTGVDRRLTA